MHTAACPNCGKEVKAEDGTLAPDYPFCSDRCRMADLDRWFTEEYRVPGETDLSAPDPDPA